MKTNTEEPSPYLTHVNLAGDTVRDLIAALKLLDPDTKTKIGAVRRVQGQLVIRLPETYHDLESDSDEMSNIERC